MTRGTVAKRRRHLAVAIPIDKRKEMKEVITKLAQERTKDVNDISREENEELTKIKEKAKETRMQRVRKYEKDRADVIDKYEKEFGKDAVDYAIAGSGV